MKKFLIWIYCKWMYRKKVNIEINAEVNLNCIFEGMNRIVEKSKIVSSYFGYGSYVGMNTTVIRAKIGKYCSIGPNVRFTSGFHPSHTFVSTHPAFFSTKKQAGFSFTEKQLFEENAHLEDGYQIIVGNDVWIGDSALILEGVTIGDGAIIGAGAVVTRDIPPYAIALGVPAKVSRYRFEAKQIEFLLELKWWDKPVEWISKHSELFTNIESMQKELKNT